MPTINGTPGDDTLTGTSGDDTINGLAGNDQISGLGGNDTIDGGDGVDTIDGGDGDDVIDSGNTAGLSGDIIHGGNGNDTLTSNGTVLGTRLYGDADDDHLIVNTRDATADGGDGDDYIEVYGGADVILGGAGNDVILYNGTTFGTIPGNIDAGDGDDRIIFVSTGSKATNIVLGAGHDVLELRVGGAKISDFATGDSGDQIDLSFFGPNPIASGRFQIVQSGADTLIQEVATDAIYVRLLNVQKSTLTAYNLSGIDPINPGQDINGTPGNDQLIGTAGNDHLSGLAGNDYIDGRAGADRMAGGQGDDAMFVDDVGDVIEELAGEGSDNVVASVSYTLNAGAAVEFLSTTDHGGMDNLNLTGNNYGQVVIGNAGSNWLDGGGGADALQGLGGNDFLFVDSDDVVLEAAGGGIDNVLARTSFALNAGQEIEFLSTTNHGGTANINLTGNEFGQVVIGNAGSNWLDGGSGGVDGLQGLGGNDFLFVDANDFVIEAVGGGYDNVLAKTNFALNAGQEIEVLSTTSHGGTAAMNLVGNEFGQIVIGNAGSNILDGGLGADNLQGLGGNDVFAFTTGLGGGNVDNILDFTAGDRIGLDDGLFVGIGGPGAMNANAFFAGTSAHDADDRIIYDAATGNLYFDADGNGGGAQILFANVIGHPALASTDFTVI